MAGAGAGFLGQNAAAKANQQAAGIAYGANSNEIQQRYAQIDQQQSANTVNADIARAQAQGKVSASASSFGGDAQTSARASNAASFSVGQQLGVEDTNSENARVAAGNDQTSAFIQEQSQINKVQPGNPLALGISLAGDAASGAADYSKLGGKF